ncbi:DUF1996 domain-containing protein [Chloropicon primus]|uniref:DUF1996 domain-containing protein n=1 Tax=Chloropicon primus TaxID=1764295 RepID=A0A5B8MPC1_9CHLO|nr:hypothetical protein A3770_05p39630 [Chloropicon primus]UPR00657.1 DUF1996 domain-containing protein [Chloropicon primus]|mmetsp:Transcript_9782/g.27876  ORF Transcript_9782/g.27876 Transcript_9782/m.27876 type:complete len:375 (+) Transcript_9782:55-1179(+)|eukprot:QDZ21445.1 hypothetical protein A3770_05p39630 [Chloropicon primus]
MAWRLVSFSLVVVVVVVVVVPAAVEATSFKLDYLVAGDVRTDPLLGSTEVGSCLSDHVHTFYGPASRETMKPNATYEALRAAGANSSTGNTEENLSLYWHPSIYKVTRGEDGSETYDLAPVWFASAYYVWRTGEATAFPDGFMMKATDRDPRARATSHCAPEPEPCEREDPGGCEPYSRDQETESFLPLQACWELEINIKFPTCWDGQRLWSEDQSHVAWSVDCSDLTSSGSFDPECFDFDCPASHPVKLPEIHFYTRIHNYGGGAHTFSDGTDTFHADYMSGWNSSELQQVLDGCENDSEAASPDFFCSDFLTFRGRRKVEGVQDDAGDDGIRRDLEQTVRPPASNTTTSWAPEPVDGIPKLPRGACTGTILL